MFTDAEIIFALAAFLFVVAALYAIRAERALAAAEHLQRRINRSNANFARALDLHERGQTDAARTIMDAEAARWDAEDLEEICP